MAESTIINRGPWTDMNGEVVRAHGGGFIWLDGYYYWFGENRVDDIKVSCYRSRDLVTWEFRNDVLTLQSKVKPVYYRTSLDLNPHQTAKGANIERPKVLYNEVTGKYVMWMHYENGKDYRDARCAVASSDTIDGAYTYHGSFNPVGYMSRDCTLFQDDDGTAYFISAARDNADLHMYRLSEDYMSIDEHVKTLWPGQYREAPAVIRRHGVYFMITSACTGWYPNQGMYAYADSLTGRWSPLFPLGDATNYDSQPTFILPVQGKETTSYLYVGDRWDPSDYHQSSYVFLPLHFPTNTEMMLGWADEVSIGWKTGHIQTRNAPSTDLYRIKVSNRSYLAAGDEQPVERQLSYLDPDLKWSVEKSAEGYVRIKSTSTNRYMAVEQTDADIQTSVVLTENESDDCDWSIVERDNGQITLIHHRTQQALSVPGNDEMKTACLAPVQSEHNPLHGRDRQRIRLTPVYA